MARGGFYIPPEVKADIYERLKQRIEKTVEEYDSAAEDEDVLTGHLGANLTTKSRPVYVPAGDPGGVWRWSLVYRKFRGRGAGATEKLLGADGIFELSVEGSSRLQAKSMLFQSKMKGGGADRRLVEQCAKLTTWREAAAVFSYSPEGFEAVTLDSALGAKGDLSGGLGKPLAGFLGGAFVDCVVGDTDLRYHPTEKLLTWTDSRGQRIAVRFEAKHRLQLKIRQPSPPEFDLQGRTEIGVDELHKHRMDVTAHDLLGLSASPTAAELKAAHRRLAKIYHPDVWSGFPVEVRETMLARSQEFSAAAQPPRRRR